jgi:hypothetical protein
LPGVEVRLLGELAGDAGRRVVAVLVPVAAYQFRVPALDGCPAEAEELDHRERDAGYLPHWFAAASGVGAVSAASKAVL